MWSSSLAAVALAAALEASPAQNTARGYDYLLGHKFVEPVTTVSGTAQTVRAQTPLHSCSLWSRHSRSLRSALRPAQLAPQLCHASARHGGRSAGNSRAVGAFVTLDHPEIHSRFD